MTEETTAKLAAITAQHEAAVAWNKLRAEKVGVPYDANEFASALSVEGEAVLLRIIDDLTRERDEHEANVGEVNQLLSDTLSALRIAENDVARLTAERDAAAAKERAEIVAFIRVNAENGKKLKQSYSGVAGVDIGVSIHAFESCANFIEQGEHLKAADAIERGDAGKGAG